MRIHLIFFTVYLISAAVRSFSVTGYSGRSLLVDCGRSSSGESQYLIKRTHRGWDIIIENKKQDQWVNKGRFTLYFDKKGNIMLFIRVLNTHDTGSYKIGVVEINVNVIGDSCCNVKKRQEVYVGRTAIFRCEYSQSHIFHDKIIFKEGNNSIEEVINSTRKKNSRFGLTDDRQKSLFSVRITAVTPDDGGVYLCGVWVDNHSHSYYVINTVHLHIMTRAGVSSVSGYSGAGLMIKCEHPQHKTKPKYICKESAGCSAVQEEWMKNGDVSVHDDTRAGVLMVFFRELKAADAGTYRCGVKESEYTEIVTQLQLSIKHDAKYPEVLNESVDLGEEVNISCQIPEEQNVHFCKEDDHQGCRIMRASEATRMNPAEPVRVFTVSISNVSVGDAGVYWCGAETRGTHLTFISLSTKIHLSLIMSPVVRREGESAEIICPYDSIYKSKSKSLCKGKCSTGDTNENERLTVKEDVTAGVFTGTITGLTAEDAGEYWCAVMLDRELNYLYTHLMVIIKQELNLTKYEGEHVSIQCKHHDGDQRRFCKAHEAPMCVKDEAIRDDRFSLSAGASAGVFTVNITDLRAEDSGLYWCGAHIITKVNLEVKKSVSEKITIIMPCVLVTLLLTGASVLLLYRLGFIKTRDHHSSTKTEMSCGEDSQAACDYENIRDIGQRLTSGAEETVLYSTVNYHTDSSDKQNELYSTVQFPTNPSEELLYSSVRFQKHGESDGNAKVLLNDDIYSHYTTLNHQS